jgi:hypothetical protein
MFVTPITYELPSSHTQEFEGVKLPLVGLAICRLNTISPVWLRYDIGFCVLPTLDVLARVVVIDVIDTNPEVGLGLPKVELLAPALRNVLLVKNGVNELLPQKLVGIVIAPEGTPAKVLTAV